MYQYIAFDFETSGLPRGRRSGPVTPETLACFDTCRAVSLSAARFSSRGRLTDTFDATILPTDFTIGEGSVAIHGITQERALREGRPFTDVFVDFMSFIGSRTKVIVAHNAKFDTNVLRSEMFRHGISMDLLKDLDFQCTMELYRSMYLKPIRLGVLYEDLFGHPFENAHTSLADCIACGRVYTHLIQPLEPPKPIGIPNVLIDVSSVPTAIGYGFNKQTDLVNQLWKKYRVMHSCETTKRILEDVESFKGDDPAQKLRSVYYHLEHSGLVPRDIVIAKDHVRRSLYEKSIHHTYDICEIEGTRYQLGGSPCRIRYNKDGTRTVIQRKHRINGLFNTVRDYENIECQTNLQVIGGDDCHLIEQFGSLVSVAMIEKNDDLWSNEILPKLVTFCTYLHRRLSVE